MNLRNASLILEKRTGSDSIPTIEDHYRKCVFVDGFYEDTDTFQCVWPGCVFQADDSAEMWLHVHLSDGHPLSFDGVRTRAAAIRLAKEPTQCPD